MTTPEERTRASLRPLLENAAAHAAGFLEGLPERRVAPIATAEELREELGGPLPEHPLEPAQVLAGLAGAAPAASVAEEVSGEWLIELFGLPREVSYGFVTGCQMANFTALTAARHSVLEAVGWDVEAGGLVGAPPIRVIVGDERHVTVDRALRFLGLGTANLRPVPADAQGRMRADALSAALAEVSGPTIVCA